MNERGQEDLSSAGWEESEIDPAELERFTPIAVIPDRPEPSVVWMDLRGESLAAPFFGDAVASFQKRNPDSMVLSTGLEALDLLAEESTAWSPAGFVFHLSRCGSTALARALASSRRLLMINEAGPVNVLVSLAEGGDAAEVQRLRLRGLLWAIARPYRAERPHCVVKLSSWNALLLPLFLAAFPEVPWMFLYRDPVEVMVSLVRSSPGWEENTFHPLDLLPGHRGAFTDPEERMAVTLGEICAAVLAAADDRTLLMSYRELSTAALAKILTHFRLPVSTGEIAAMGESLRTDAKHPERGLFVPDSEDKRKHASNKLVEFAERRARKPYDRLEERRLFQRNQLNIKKIKHE